MNKSHKIILTDNCRSRLRAVHDTLDIIGGKWKIRIISFLSFGPSHFMTLQRLVDGIGSKMLSQELKQLEINGLVKRTVYDTRPVTVEYELTDYGQTLRNILEEMEAWGFNHRQHIFKPEGELEQV